METGGLEFRGHKIIVQSGDILSMALLIVLHQMTVYGFGIVVLAVKVKLSRILAHNKSIIALFNPRS